MDTPRPSPRTNRTRRVPLPVQISEQGAWGHSDYPFNVGGRLPPAHRSDYSLWYLAEFVKPGQAQPPPRTKWTRLVPRPVLIGHAWSLSQAQPSGVEWTKMHRMRRIKTKMLEKASSAEKMCSPPPNLIHLR